MLPVQEYGSQAADLRRLVQEGECTVHGISEIRRRPGYSGLPKSHRSQMEEGQRRYN